MFSLQLQRSVSLVFVVFISVLILKINLYSAFRDFYFPY